MLPKAATRRQRMPNASQGGCGGAEMKSILLIKTSAGGVGTLTTSGLAEQSHWVFVNPRPRAVVFTGFSSFLLPFAHI
jgi:hypothetical protein